MNAWERGMYEGREARELGKRAVETLVSWCQANEWHLFVTQTPARQASAQGMAILTTRSLAEWSSLFGVKRALWSVESFEKGGYHAHMLLWTQSWRTFRNCASRSKSARLSAYRMCAGCENYSLRCWPARKLSSMTTGSVAGVLPWWKLANEWFRRSVGICRTYWIGDDPRAAVGYSLKYLLKKQSGMDGLPWGLYTEDRKAGDSWH